MNSLVEKKQTIDTLIEILCSNKQNIQDWLITYVNMKKNTKMLDSFYFQSKLIDAEYELVQKIYKMIDNRMYGEYYKLWLSMHIYAKELLKEEMVRFPPYKDLEPIKQYEFSVTNSIYEEIISIFQKLKQSTDKSQKDIDVHKEQLHKGIHIENYINILSYQLGLVLDQVNLFNNMFTSYQTYHHQRYDHFIQKIELLNSQLDEKSELRKTVYPCELCNIHEALYCKMCANIPKAHETPAIVLAELPVIGETPVVPQESPVETPEVVLEETPVVPEETPVVPEETPVESRGSLI